MNNNIEEELEYSIQLVKEGQPELAEVILKTSVEEFINQPPNEKSKKVLELIEKASHYGGIDIALQYAGYFYQKGDKRAARGWLRYAKMHAKPLKLNIKDRISRIKSKYKDKMPLLF